MKISIITINLNNREGLKKTIESVISQTYQDFELIIIDGGSTDGSIKIIEENSKYIKYWCSEIDRGIYNAMNKGVLASTGEYVIFLNSGDYFNNNFVLKKVIPFLKGSHYYGGIELRGNNLFDYNINSEDDILHVMFTKKLPHQSTFISRKVFEEFGLYNENYKIISESIKFFNDIICYNASVEKIPFIISNFDTNGISTRERELYNKENKIFLQQINRLITLYQFYRDHKDIVECIFKYKSLFLIFRIYFFIYRNKKQNLFKELFFAMRKR